MLVGEGIVVEQLRKKWGTDLVQWCAAEVRGIGLQGSCVLNKQHWTGRAAGSRRAEGAASSWYNHSNTYLSLSFSVFRCCMQIAIWPVRNFGKCLMAPYTTSWGSNFSALMLFQKCTIKSAKLQDISLTWPDSQGQLDLTMITKHFVAVPKTWSIFVIWKFIRLSLYGTTASEMSTFLRLLRNLSWPK